MKNFVKLVVAGWFCVSITSTAMGGWKAPEVYAGIAVSGERTNLKRTEGIWDNHEDVYSRHDPHWVTMSHGKKVSEHALAGHVFVGALWNLPRSCFFVGPELMGGWGNTSQRLQKKRYMNWSETEKSFDATLQRRMNWSAVMRFGMMVSKGYRVYALAGVSREQFRYTVNYHYSSDVNLHIPAQFARQTKWATGAVWGIGIEKKIRNFHIGLEGRITHHHKLKFYKRFSPETTLAPHGALNPHGENLSSRVRPRTNSIFIKISYVR